MNISFGRNIKSCGTQRSSLRDAVDYAAWCQDVEVDECIEYYGRFLGNRFIRVYYKTTEQ